MIERRLNSFRGVFVPSFEAILGAVLFLVLPLLVSSVGLASIIVIVLLANSVTIATAFSIADTATNLRHIGSGGMYAIAKRSLGLALGGSIGLQLYLAQAISIGFYCAGFAESLASLLEQSQTIKIAYFDNLSFLQQRQIIASVIGLLIFILSVTGSNVVARIQLAIFIILAIASIAILISPLFSPTNGGEPVFTAKPIAPVAPSLGFWVAFAIFFPAVTGIDAGVGMSGLLKNARLSLPRGTFTAIIATLLIYIGCAAIYSYVRPDILYSGSNGVPSVLTIFRDSPLLYSILIVGIITATGSSALGYFITAPRTLQALAQDGLLPSFLLFLGRDWRVKGTEPRWAALFTLGIVMGIIWAGDLAFASLLVGISFLMVYGWVNLSAFLERISGNPSFRPTSRGHWAISLYGFAISMLGISLFSVYVGIAVILFQLIVFWLLLRYRQGNHIEGVWWGVLFALVKWILERLNRIARGGKNWRPIVTAFLFRDREIETADTIKMLSLIGDYKGLTMVNYIDNQYSAETIVAVADSRLPGDLIANTILLPADSRLDLGTIVAELATKNRNILLYRHGATHAADIKRIDVWWKGERNGNLMALLAHIIRTSDERDYRGETKHIRILRQLPAGNDIEAAHRQLDELLIGARLEGESAIIPADEGHIEQVVRKYSGDAQLILMGMPGQISRRHSRLIYLDTFKLIRQIEKYADMPPILFVKAAASVNLLE